MYEGSFIFRLQHRRSVNRGEWRLWHFCLPKGNYYADEFLRVIIRISVVMLVPLHGHGLDEALLQVFDEAWLFIGHIGYERLQNPFMGQNTSLEICRFRQ